MRFIPTDVAKLEDCRNAVETTLRAFGGIHILFNNAGMALVKPLHETTEAEWDTIMDTNLKSIFRMSKLVIPHMIEQGGGSIINTGSQLSFVAAPNFAAYLATKGAIVNLSRAMAVDYAKKIGKKDAVRVAAISTVTPTFASGVIEMPDIATDSAFAVEVCWLAFPCSVPYGCGRYRPCPVL